MRLAGVMSKLKFCIIVIYKLHNLCLLSLFRYQESSVNKILRFMQESNSRKISSTSPTPYNLHGTQCKR